MKARRQYYRDKFNGKLLGVCAGFGDYFDIDPLFIRIGFLVIMFSLFPPVILIYFAVAMLTEKRPPEMYTQSLNAIFGDEGDQITPATRRKDEQ